MGVWGFVGWANESYMTPDNFGIGFDESTNCFTTGAYEVLPESVGQWTGLVDKNRVEIYEGDVIGGLSKLVTLRGNPTGDYTETRFVVEWDEKRAKFTALQTYDSRYPDFYATRKASTELTIIADYHPVIGNVIDSPELMEVE